MTSPAEHSTPSTLAVIGAGPAGLAAAVHAAEAGLATTLIDAASRRGGQYWRHGPAGLDADLHHHVAVYDDLGRRLDKLVAAGRATVLAGHQVWSLRADDHGCTIAAVNRDGTGPAAEQRLHTDAVVLAVGAYDRQVPFPGWDLPGVMTVGGAQALLKGSGVAVGPRVVVAGTGPFLLPVATGLAGRGSTVLGVYEANRPSRWLAHLPAAGRQLAKLREAAGYAAALLRHRIPVRNRTVVLAAHGTDHLEAVTVARLDRDGRVRPSTHARIATDVLAIGYGFTTQSELPLQAGCDLHTTSDGTLAVLTDEAQRTTNPRIYAAGETTGIGGAQLAVAEGIIAGCAAAGATVPQETIKLRDLLREFAAAMHSVYPVPPFWIDGLEPGTVVCRCEEVTVAEIDAAITDGACDARSVKLLSRAGMGWCQGRECAYATSCLVAHRTGREPDLRSGADRPVAAPITLGLLAETENH